MLTPLKNRWFIRSLNKMMNAVARGELTFEALYKKLDAFMRNKGLRDETA